MTIWLERARAKFSEMASQGTVNTTVRNPTTITTVGHPAEFAKIEGEKPSNDCNDSTSSGHFPKIEAPAAFEGPGLEPANAQKQAPLGTAKTAKSPPGTARAHLAVQLGWSETELFGPYQHEAVQAAFGSWQAGHTAPLLVLPTGAGKTIVFAEIARRALPVISSSTTGQRVRPPALSADAASSSTARSRLQRRASMPAVLSRFWRGRRGSRFSSKRSTRTSQHWARREER